MGLELVYARLANRIMCGGTTGGFDGIKPKTGCGLVGVMGLPNQDDFSIFIWISCRTSVGVTGVYA